MASTKHATGLGLAAFLLSACAGMTSAPQPAVPAPPPAAPPPVTMIPPMAIVMPAVPALAAQPKDADGVRAQYGAPDFIRREADSELWRYDSGACAVFFFLYREGAVLRLRYIETMPEGMGMTPDPACLAGLSARARPMS